MTVDQILVHMVGSLFKISGAVIEGRHKKKYTALWTSASETETNLLSSILK